jgi:hypothetical protein
MAIPPRTPPPLPIPRARRSLQGAVPSAVAVGRGGASDVHTLPTPPPRVLEARLEQGAADGWSGAGAAPLPIAVRLTAVQVHGVSAGAGAARGGAHAEGGRSFDVVVSCALAKRGALPRPPRGAGESMMSPRGSEPSGPCMQRSWTRLTALQLDAAMPAEGADARLLMDEQLPAVSRGWRTGGGNVAGASGRMLTSTLACAVRAGMVPGRGRHAAGGCVAT